MKYYLKTSYACNLYEIHVAQWDKKVDESQYVVFDESKIPYFKKLATEIHDCMESFWQKKGLDGKNEFRQEQKYSYVTTSYCSHLKNLKVIKNKIPKKENTCTCPCNYFLKEGDAEELCKKLKEILKSYGVL